MAASAVRLKVAPRLSRVRNPGYLGLSGSTLQARGRGARVHGLDGPSSTCYAIPAHPRQGTHDKKPGTGKRRPAPAPPLAPPRPHHSLRPPRRARRSARPAGTLMNCPLGRRCPSPAGGRDSAVIAGDAPGLALRRRARKPAGRSPEREAGPRSSPPASSLSAPAGLGRRQSWPPADSWRQKWLRAAEVSVGPGAPLAAPLGDTFTRKLADA